MVSIRLILGRWVLEVVADTTKPAEPDSEPPPQLAGGQGQLVEVWPEPAFGFHR